MQQTVQKFEVGRTYAGWKGDEDPTITLIGFESGKYLTACGRAIKPVIGQGPRGGIEVLRVDCNGTRAMSGVFRADCGGITRPLHRLLLGRECCRLALPVLVKLGTPCGAASSEGSHAVDGGVNLGVVEP